MTILNDDKKKEYIKTKFHQYFDFMINKNIKTTETINLIIPIEDLYKTSSASEILNNYDDTEIEKEKKVYCTSVIDGDTIWVRDVITDDETNKTSLDKSSYKVRFVGIDTPELDSTDETDLYNANLAKNFVEQCCLHKFIYLNIDNKKELDNYERTLAVVIVQNKNLNEVLLKENMANIMYIPPSEFNPHDWDNTSIEESSFDQNSQDISILSPYLRDDMKNIVFTPCDNLDTLYRYEIYKNVIYIKLSPYSQKIRMHVLPKTYDCSDRVLIFRDSDMRANISKSTNYRIDTDDDINAYFQVNGNDRNRNTITSKTYNIHNWQDESDMSKTFVEYSYDISKITQGLSNLEICAGYQYNNTSPYYALHYTGVKDNRGRPEDRCTLVDANIDSIKGAKSNIITQMSFYDPDEDFTNTDNDIIYLKHDVNILKEIGNNDHISEIGQIFHKKIKYINDLLYIEEGRVYGSQEWKDPIIYK